MSADERGYVQESAYKNNCHENQIEAPTYEFLVP